MSGYLRRLWSRWTVAATAVLLILTMAAALARASGAETKPLLSPEADSFIDQQTGRYLTVQLMPQQTTTGTFTFAVPGVGLFISSIPARVASKDRSTITLYYDGAGTLDREAKLDILGATRTQTSGVVAVVHIRLEAEVDRAQGSAHAQLWSDNASYTMESRVPQHDADRALKAIIDALVDQDWHMLYAYNSRLLRTTKSEGAFATMMDNAVRAVGAPVRGSIVTVPAYSSKEGGHFLATARLALTTEKGDMRQVRTYDVQVVPDADGWRYTGMNRVSDATPTAGR